MSKKRKKESLRDRLIHDENAWARNTEQMAQQTQFVSEQFAEITRHVNRQVDDVKDIIVKLENRISKLERKITKLKHKRRI